MRAEAVLIRVNRGLVGELWSVTAVILQDILVCVVDMALASNPFQAVWFVERDGPLRRTPRRTGQDSGPAEGWRHGVCDSE